MSHQVADRGHVAKGTKDGTSRASPNGARAHPAGRWPAGPLLRWFEDRRDAYPWRGEPDPYRVLVSEAMLQQTQAARVAPAFRMFVGRYPTVRSLAEAPAADVIRAWDGLGYNRRAVSLHRAARAIVERFGGAVPADPSDLRALPGVGPYTAAAVSSIAHGLRVPAVDTNVRRVLARAVLGMEPAEASVSEVHEVARRLVPARAGEWNQALMDLGREICRPVPRCGSCPLADRCAARREGRVPLPQAAGPVVARARRVRPPPFEGSTRQMRGRLVSILRARGTITIADATRATGADPLAIGALVEGLARDGLCAAGPAALAGRPRGMIRLPR